MENKIINIKYKSFSSFKDIDEETLKLIKSAQKSSLKAYAPYSKFNVGASVLLDGGIIVDGNNQENAVYPLGLCAERVALFYAKAKYPKKKIKAIAIISNKDNRKNSKIISPCGSCRQVLIEYEVNQKQNIKIIMALMEGKGLIFESVKDLLPFSFDINNL